MAKRSKKANLVPKHRRPERPVFLKMKMRRGKLEPENLNYIPSMIKYPKITTISIHTISEETTENSDLLDSNECALDTRCVTPGTPAGTNKDGSTRNRNCEDTDQQSTPLKPPPAVSEMTVYGEKINLEDVRLKVIPPPMPENTVILPVEGPSNLIFNNNHKTTFRETIDSTADSKGAFTQNTPRSEAPRLIKRPCGKTTVLENEIVDDMQYEPVRDPNDKPFRVKRRIRKKYKNRNANLKQRANIAMRRLQIYL